jgi:Na+-translocating ferredoxin:NAD+ oxidoreductase RnfA subunit
MVLLRHGSSLHCESIEFSDVPGIAKGAGLVLIIAGTLSRALMGFAAML